MCAGLNQSQLFFSLFPLHVTLYELYIYGCFKSKRPTYLGLIKGSASYSRGTFLPSGGGGLIEPAHHSHLTF